MLLIREEAVQQILTMDMCIQAVEECYRQLGEGKASNTPRQNLWTTPPRSIKLAAGGLPEIGFMGVSAYSAGFGQKGSGAASTLLYDSNSGKLVAILESKFLGWYRTGGTSAVAAKYLAPTDSEALALIGTGRQARSQLLALRKVLKKLKVVRAFSRSLEHRENYAREMGRETGLDILPAETAKDCVARADVVITITTSREPVLKKEWIKEGSLVSALGGHYPEASEVDVDTVLSSRVIVDSREQALIEKGEILVPIRKGLATDEIIKAELGEVVCGSKRARITVGERVLFCSGGISAEQIAVAARIYLEAIRQGLGQEL
ncbi:MAG TPA: ornithine cyclodeaminase family protein [Nitrososphaerales archaeon]|nr:ornithine cyclodeaminase family protein [Nitrososphaerales archaeon]